MSRLTQFITFLRFMVAAAGAYRNAATPGAVAYSAVSRFGVPCTTLVVARGREAWRVSHLAIEAYKSWKDVQSLFGVVLKGFYVVALDLYSPTEMQRFICGAERKVSSHSSILQQREG